jgi:hypothetical protein
MLLHCSWVVARAEMRGALCSAERSARGDFAVAGSSAE